MSIASRASDKISRISDAVCSRVRKNRHLLGADESHVGMNGVARSHFRSRPLPTARGFYDKLSIAYWACSSVNFPSYSEISMS